MGEHAMKIIDTIKGWLGMGKKPEPEPPAEVKTVTLPNGRLARVDDKGNFVGWANE